MNVECISVDVEVVKYAWSFEVNRKHQKSGVMMEPP